MRHVEFGDQAIQRARFFERIQILALDVLDQRHRDRGFIGHAAHDRRNLVQARELRGAPAALAGDDFVARVARALGPSPSGRTTIGCTTPCALIESASSCSVSCRMSMRG